MKIIFIFSLLFHPFTSIIGWGQSPEYQKQKADKIENGSVFTKIINRELPATIVYEEDDIIAFVPLKLQAPVHLLIVPKKEIHTINNVTDEDLIVLRKLFWLLKN